MKRLTMMLAAIGIAVAPLPAYAAPALPAPTSEAGANQLTEDGSGDVWLYVGIGVVLLLALILLLDDDDDDDDLPASP